MNFPTRKDLDRNAEVIEAEQTLRLIASLPSPGGLEERLKTGLRSAPAATGVIVWPLSSANRTGWAEASYLRAAAAAAIVFVVAGSGWGVYAHFQPAPTPAAEMMPQRIEGGSGLSPAGAMRTPKTVEGPRIAVPANDVTRETNATTSVSRQKPTHGLRRQDQKSKVSIPSAAVR